MTRNNGVVRRIDIELDDMLKELAKRNGMSVKQASKEAAKALKINMKGIKREITF